MNISFACVHDAHVRNPPTPYQGGTTMADNFNKFFRNGKTFSSYCRYRYGYAAVRQIWDEGLVWRRSGRYAIAFDQEAADSRYGNRQNGLNHLKPAHCEEAFDDENYAERQMEEMAAYIHSGAGLAAYYEDRDAGYAY